MRVIECYGRRCVSIVGLWQEFSATHIIYLWFIVEILCNSHYLFVVYFRNSLQLTLFICGLLQKLSATHIIYLWFIAEILCNSHYLFVVYLKTSSSHYTA